MSGLITWAKRHPWLTAGLTAVSLCAVYSYLVASATSLEALQGRSRANLALGCPSSKKKRELEELVRKNKELSRQNVEQRAREEASRSPVVPAAPVTPKAEVAWREVALGEKVEAFRVEGVLGDSSLELSNESLKGKWYAVFFFPHNWSSTKALLALDAQFESFSARNCQVFAVSSQNVFSHESWNARERANGGGGNVRFALVGDEEKTLSAVFGVPVVEGKYQSAWLLVDPSGTVREKGLGFASEEALAALELTSSSVVRSSFHKARGEIASLVHEKKCGPILVRFAWHDAGTYSKADGTGGSHATLLRASVSAHSANKGLHIAVNLLEPIRARYPEISAADFYQFAAVVAIEAMHGPKILFRYGREDASSLVADTPSDRLPDGRLGADHLREVFGRMGFTDRDIVALSGAHSVGSCHRERSGWRGKWTADALLFDNEFFVNLLTKKWTEAPGSDPVQFEDESKQFMMLPSDVALLTDASFKSFVEKYAKSQEAWFSDFSYAFQKLQELGHRNLKPLPLHS